ncbi:MAG: PRC-barrel domain-containing protein [Devosia sp.]
MTLKSLSVSLIALTIAVSGSALAATTTPDLVPSGYTIASTDALASRVINSKVYSGAAADAAEIGYVKDIVLGASGQISAVVLGIGGFLGAGEKNVAVAYSQIQWTLESDGSLRGTLNSTKDALAAAPDFNFPDYTAIAQASSASSALMSSSSSMLVSSSSAPQAGDVDVTSLKPLDVASLKVDDLKGTDVISPTGQKLGSVDDFVLSADGKVDAVIVEFGGFLGLGTKHVAVAYQGLKFMLGTNNERYLVVDVTKDQLNAQPDYNKDDYATNRDNERLVLKP